MVIHRKNLWRRRVPLRLRKFLGGSHRARLQRTYMVGAASFNTRSGDRMTLPIIVATATTLLVLGVGGWMTKVGGWYENLRKPWWNPPDWIFGPAWTVILGLAAWAGLLAWTLANSNSRQLLIVLFGINIVLHMLWSPLFFNLKRPDWALVEVPFLWLSILALMIGVAPFSISAVWLLLPYLLWVTFAAFLNLTIVRMNRPFGN
jgi:translocator protein